MNDAQDRAFDDYASLVPEHAIMIETDPVTGIAHVTDEDAGIEYKIYPDGKVNA